MVICTFLHMQIIFVSAMEQLQDVLRNSRSEGFDRARKLIKKGVNVNEPIGQERSTLLHYEITRAHTNYYEDFRVNKIKFLLEHNADLEIQNNYGLTPFDAAVHFNDNEVLATFSLYGYRFFSAHAGQEKNPFELLKDNARLYKELIAADDIHAATATNTLAELFIFIQNNENNALGCRKTCGVGKGIVINREGCVFKHTIFADLISLVGKEAVDFVKQDLKQLCEEAFNNVQSDDQDLCATIQSEYPFVNIYRERNFIELLKNEAELFCKLVKSNEARYVKNLFAHFFSVLATMEWNCKDITNLDYLSENIGSYDDLERRVGKEGIRYVKENLAVTGQEILRIAESDNVALFKLKAAEYPFAIWDQRDNLFAWLHRKYRGFPFSAEKEAHDIFDILFFPRHLPIFPWEDQELGHYFFEMMEKAKWANYVPETLGMSMVD